MIRNVVVRITNEQPFLADLRGLPSASDNCLVCTNIRTSSGKPPTFVDRSDSWFLIPLSVVRMVEMPLVSVEDEQDFAGADAGDGVLALHEPLDLESDEDLLRRIREV